MDTDRPTTGPFAVSLAPRGPLGEIHVKFEDRFCSVYGKNGVGKTWLLRSLHQALSGIESDQPAWVHFRLNEEWLEEDRLDGTEAMVALIIGAFSDEVERITGGFESSRIEIKLRSPMPLRGLLREVISERFTNPKENAFLNELTNSCQLAFKPIGRDESRWRVYAALSPAEDTPALNALIEYQRYQRDVSIAWEKRLRQAKARHDAGEEDALRDVLEEMALPSDQVDERHRRLSELGVEPEHLRSLESILESLPKLVDVGLPIPLVEVCDLSISHGFSVFVNEASAALAERTLTALSAGEGEIVRAMSDTEVWLTPNAERKVERASNLATQFIKSTLGDDAPQLRCRIPGWRSGRPLVWEASTNAGATWISFDNLGSGHQRWANASTVLALLDLEAEVIGEIGSAWIPSWQTIMLMDEPEVGLHPAAQRIAFEGLARFARGYSLLVASHSPIPFGMAEIRLLHLHQDDGGDGVLSVLEDELRYLLSGDRGSISSLGLDPADALQAVSTFLLVEGEHDRVVLLELLEREFSQLRVTCLAFRGTKAIGAANVGMLLQFSDATICFVVDHNTKGLLEQCWAESLNFARKGEKAAAKKALEGLSLGTSEQEFLRSVCLESIERGHQERIHVTGWEVPDVICLLPVAEFLPGFNSWDDVQKRRRPRQNLKEIIKELHPQGRAVSIQWLRNIVGNLDEIPTEVIDLLNFLRSR